jgi:hypothetical protein
MSRTHKSEVIRWSVVGFMLIVLALTLMIISHL